VAAPLTEVRGCRLAHAKLQAAITDLTDGQVASPSLLPDWTVGHVLSHIARNADAMSRRVTAALRSETVDQYVGGADGRIAEIDAGAARPADEIVADVRRSAEQLDALFATLPADGWTRPVQTVGGGEHPVALLPFRRWREVEIHLVDLGLGLGSTPEDWPSDLVDLMLPRLTASLTERCDHRVLAAWALGRGPAPELGPWG